MKVIKIMCLFVLIPVITGCGEGKDHVFNRPVIKDVEISEVSSRLVPLYYDVSAVVVPRNTSVVGARIMGHITSVHIREGDKVDQGQLLFTIEEGDAAERLKAARQTLREARHVLEITKERKELNDITYERYKRLFDESAVTHQEMDEIETIREISEIEYKRAVDAVEKARANLRIAEVNYEFVKVYSPSSGIVVDKKVDKGSLVIPGSPLAIIEETTGYRIEFRVDERFLDEVKPGKRVKITISSLGKVLEEEISEVVSSVDPETRTFLVKIDLPSVEELRGGLYAIASIPVREEKSLLIPLSSVVKRGQLEGVYVVNNEEVVSYRLIKVGSSYGSDVVVLSGLREGERIITGNVEAAIDGGVIEQE